MLRIRREALAACPNDDCPALEATPGPSRGYRVYEVVELYDGGNGIWDGPDEMPVCLECETEMVFLDDLET